MVGGKTVKLFLLNKRLFKITSQKLTAFGSVLIKRGSAFLRLGFVLAFALVILLFNDCQGLVLVSLLKSKVFRRLILVRSNLNRRVHLAIVLSLYQSVPPLEPEQKLIDCITEHDANVNNSQYAKATQV